jgi:hypothetical protein
VKKILKFCEDTYRKEIQKARRKVKEHEVGRKKEYKKEVIVRGWVAKS